VLVIGPGRDAADSGQRIDFPRRRAPPGAGRFVGPLLTSETLAAPTIKIG